MYETEEPCNKITCLSIREKQGITFFTWAGSMKLFTALPKMAIEGDGRKCYGQACGMHTASFDLKWAEQGKKNLSATVKTFNYIFNHI